MTTRMIRLQLIGLRSDLAPAVQVLGRLGSVHLEDIRQGASSWIQRLETDETFAQEQERLRVAVGQIEALLEAMGRSDKQHPALSDRAFSLPEVEQQLEQLAPQVRELTARRECLQAELDLLPRFEATLSRLLPLLPEDPAGPDQAFIGALVHRGHSEVVQLIREQVLQLAGGEAEVVSGEVDEATLGMLILAPKVHSEQIRQLLDSEDVSRLHLPGALERETPQQAWRALRRRQAAIPAQILEVQAELRNLAERYAATLAGWLEQARDELTQYEVFEHIGQTDQTFVLEGWVPEGEFEAIGAALTQAVGERFQVTRLPVGPKEAARAPVLLTNWAAVRPFEGLVTMLRVPRYGGIDPSGLMAIFLPAFFGLMLGDIGYGAMLLLAGLVARRRLRFGPLRDLATVLAIGAGWSIGFGFLFGELFGSLGSRLGLRPLWFDRADPQHLLRLLVLAASIGGGHLALGLGIGVWESLRTRSRPLLLERGSKLVTLATLVALVGVLAGQLPDRYLTPTLALLVVGLALLVASLGRKRFLLAPIEMLGIVGNLLSYLRIAAIGLASVYLAVVANELAGAFGSIAVGLIVATLIHALNLALGAFTPLLQSLRLHYVEFFQHFYEGGGTLYRPYLSREFSTVSGPGKRIGGES